MSTPHGPSAVAGSQTSPPSRTTVAGCVMRATPGPASPLGRSVRRVVASIHTGVPLPRDQPSCLSSLWDKVVGRSGNVENQGVKTPSASTLSQSPCAATPLTVSCRLFFWSLRRLLPWNLVVDCLIPRYRAPPGALGFGSFALDSSAGHDDGLPERADNVCCLAASFLGTVDLLNMLVKGYLVAVVANSGRHPGEAKRETSAIKK